MIAINKDERINLFWNSFLIKFRYPDSVPCKRIFTFSLEQKESIRLLRLVASRKKDLAISPFSSYSDLDEIPKAGDLSIVTDSTGYPHFVIETVSAEIVPFSAVDFEHAKRVDDITSLLKWQLEHINRFKETGKHSGFDFSSDSPVICEEFRLVYRE